MFGVGIGLASKTFLHLLVLHFLPLIVTTRPGGGETALIQTVVVADVFYVLCGNNVAAGDGMVAAVGGALQAPASSALQIVPC